jgi:transposase
MIDEALVVMTQKELRRYQIIQQMLSGRLNGSVAARFLDLSVRQVRRLKSRVKDQGAPGLKHASRGRSSNNRLGKDVVEQARALLSEHYAEFKPTHASEQLAERHGIHLSKETTRRLMMDLDLWQSRARRLKKHYRAWRPRKDYFGEMLQYDGSTHHWFAGSEGKCTLLLAIDDATGQITYARFAEGEGVVDTFGFWQYYVITLGKPLKIYLDRFSTYANLPKKNHPIDPRLTQFQRACEELDIELVYARSPQAKGRVERVFSTLQDRLVNELRLHGIKNRAKANEYLHKQFIPAFNRKFGVQANKREDLHRALSAQEQSDLGSIFSLQETRLVQHDFTVQYSGRWYQLKRDQPTLVRSRDVVTIEEQLDGGVNLKKGRYPLNFVPLPERPDRSYKPNGKGKARIPAKDHPWHLPYLKKERERQRLEEIERRQTHV